MTAAALTLHQVLLMLALLAAGVICTRLGWFDEGVAQALSKFLLWLSRLPCCWMHLISRSAPIWRMACCFPVRWLSCFMQWQLFWRSCLSVPGASSNAQPRGWGLYILIAALWHSH